LSNEPRLARRLDDAEPLFTKPLAITGLPYGHVSRTSECFYRLGDQAAMTASLTGDGMAIALRSALAASEAVLSDVPPDAYQRRFAGAVSGQVRRAMWLQRAAETPPLLALASPVLRLWPGLLRQAAAMTRLPT
jgi:menaquinone-9 beta-reductase